MSERAATVGSEGMLGVSVFLGDLIGTGRTLQRAPDGLLPTMTARQFAEHTVTLVLGALQKVGLISIRYGRIRILNRSGLEKA